MNIESTKLRRFKVILTPLSSGGIACSFEIKYKIKAIECIRICRIKNVSLALVFEVTVRGIRLNTDNFARIEFDSVLNLCLRSRIIKHLLNRAVQFSSVVD